MSAVITPTPGRIVWYWPSANDGIPALPGQPLAAIITAVHSDHRVNLAVFDSYGNNHARGNISLVQPDYIRPQPGSISFAEWMPYQVGQAGKTEQMQVALLDALTTGTGGVQISAVDPAAMFADSDGTSASETGLVGDVSVDPPDGADTPETDEAQK